MSVGYVAVGIHMIPIKSAQIVPQGIQLNMVWPGPHPEVRGPAKLLTAFGFPTTLKAKFSVHMPDCPLGQESRASVILEG